MHVCVARANVCTHVCTGMCCSVGRLLLGLELGRSLQPAAGHAPACTAECQTLGRLALHWRFCVAI